MPKLMYDDVIVLALCEYEQLVLKPNTLYKFVPIKDCKRCTELNNEYKENHG